MDIIDTPFNTTPKILCLVSHGVGTVIRYYNFSNSLSFPEKCLQLAEAQALGSQGVRIAVVFQQRQNQEADFSQSKGEAAGRRAYRHAQDNIGQPGASAIYFAVDFDATHNQIENNVAPYFEGVKGAFDEESAGAPEYRIGAYGSGLVCGTLTNKGLIDFVWLAMSRGFSGTREALAAGEFHLTQRAPAATLCGLGVDFNDPNPAHPDFGTFTLSDDTPEHGSIGPVADRYRVVARGGLRLREGAGTQFDIIGGLPFGQIVFVVSISEGWARVDIEGDGRIDGFASAGFLERAETQPPFGIGWNARASDGSDLWDAVTLNHRVAGIPDTASHPRLDVGVRRDRSRPPLEWSSNQTSFARRSVPVGRGNNLASPSASSSGSELYPVYLRAYLATHRERDDAAQFQMVIESRSSCWRQRSLPGCQPISAVTPYSSTTRS